MKTQEDLKQTLMQVVRTDRSRWPVYVVSFGQELDLAVVERTAVTFEQSEILLESPLILRFRNSYMVFFEYGELVAWEGDPLDLVDMLGLLSRQVKLTTKPASHDSFEVLVAQVEDCVSFHSVRLQRLSVEHIKVISKNLAQSAALERCDKEIGDLLVEWRPTVCQLAASGRMALAGRQLHQMIGKTLSIRETTIGRMAVIDSPQEAWKSERLSKLHFELYEQFRFRQRMEALEKKLHYLFDLNDTLINIVRHRESHYLEWIVILLIVVEVIYSTIHFIFPAV